MKVSLAAARARAAAKGDTVTLAALDEMQARVDDLETALGMKAADLYPRLLSPAQRAMLGILFKRVNATKDQLMTAVYAGRCGADMPNDPDMVFKVQLCRLRRRVAPDGIIIETCNADQKRFESTVYRLTVESKNAMRVIMTAREAA